jgi:hypothetical protein
MFSRTTRVLLLAALLAAGAYFLLARSGDRTTEDPSRLLTFDVARVDGVILGRIDTTLRFARSDSLWRVIEPVSDTAESATITSLLDALRHAHIARNLGAPDDLAPFGLDAPDVRITLLSGVDTLGAVSIGKRTVDAAWCFARAGSEDLLLIPTDVARAASLPRDAYRSRRVVDFQLRDVADYVVAGEDHGTAWARGARGWFSVPEPGDTVRGDSVAVESVLRRLRGLRVAAFVADADSHLVRTSTPLGDISLRQIARPPYTRPTIPLAHLSIYRNARGTLVIERVSGRAVLVDDDLRDVFEPTTTSLRDRRLLQFAPPDVARVELVSPSASGSIVRAGGAWSFPNPARGRVDPRRAADFIRALRALKWTSPASTGTSAFHPAHFSVTMTDAGGNMIDQMQAVPGPQGTWYVTSRSSRGTWQIEGERLTALSGQFAALKEP